MNPSAAAKPRKGVTRTVDVPADLHQSLSRGETQSATLTECLAVDQVLLARTVFPALPNATREAIDAAGPLGILKRMSSIGAALLDALGADGIATCQTHRADTVRGWACFMIGASPAWSLAERLALIRPLADDPHFGVREWAWLAVRPQLARELPAAIQQLAPWTAQPSERLRRFASEALRPRGVWCAHIGELKRDPAQALPLLTPLRADPAAYVQDSVANWLNDAAKDQPDWVRALCATWLKASPIDATQRICQRAQRSLR